MLYFYTESERERERRRSKTFLWNPFWNLLTFNLLTENVFYLPHKIKEEKSFFSLYPPRFRPWKSCIINYCHMYKCMDALLMDNWISLMDFANLLPFYWLARVDCSIELYRPMHCLFATNENNQMTAMISPVYHLS